MTRRKEPLQFYEALWRLAHAGLLRHWEGSAADHKQWLAGVFAGRETVEWDEIFAAHLDRIHSRILPLGAPDSGETIKVRGAAGLDHVLQTRKDIFVIERGKELFLCIPVSKGKEPKKAK